MSLVRAMRSLEGLSVGDAFGERFFSLAAARLIGERALPKAPWRWTDDTAMAISVCETLAAHGAIDGDDLARRFAARYAAEPHRGYGSGAAGILGAIHYGADWRTASREAFGGQGSLGNGGGMRAAPVGAFFGEDTRAVVENAERSAEPTHAHREGRAGAVAVALAAAWAARGGAASGLLPFVADHMEDSLTRDGVRQAAAIPFERDLKIAAAALGTGARVSAQDTIPFALWCAARHLDSFEECMWTTVAGLGDRDTTCAIAGGIVAAGGASIPAAWIAAREPLPKLA